MIEAGIAPRRLYAVQCGPATVQVLVTAEQAGDLRKDLAPYLVLDRCHHLLDSVWTVATTDAAPTGTRVTHQPRTPGDVGYHIALDQAARRLTVLPADQETEHTQCRRLIRAVLRHELSGNGAVFLHAAISVAAISGKGILIAGATRSGKTSLLLAMLLSGRFGFCANDAAAVLTSPGAPPQGIGSARAISIRDDTLGQLHASDRLRAAIRQPRHPRRRNVSRTADATWLLPDELCAATASRIHPSTPLHMIVFPRFGPEMTIPRLTRLTNADLVAQRLIHLTEGIADSHEWWLGEYFPDSTSTSTSIDADAKRLAEQLPAFELTHSMPCLQRSAELILTTMNATDSR